MPGRSILFNEVESLLSNEPVKYGDIIHIPMNRVDTKFVVLGVNINANPDSITGSFVDLMCETPFKFKFKDDYITLSELEVAEKILLSYSQNSDVKDKIARIYDQFPMIIKKNIIRRQARELRSIDIFTGKRVYETVDLGAIWLPSLTEVFGSYMKGYAATKSNDDPNTKIYPYFKKFEAYDDIPKREELFMTRSVERFSGDKIGVGYMRDKTWYYSSAYNEVDCYICIRLRLPY